MGGVGRVGENSDSPDEVGQWAYTGTSREPYVKYLA